MRLKAHSFKSLVSPLLTLEQFDLKPNNGLVFDCYRTRLCGGKP
jgi:hypothetical protein